ncbi:MAG: glycine zipper domain-containing protein [Pirellulaceae bacterium]|nr:hypothetical protein [Planctomycetales bacterium]
MKALVLRRTRNRVQRWLFDSFLAIMITATVVSTGGCQTANHTKQGALFGGLGGAGLGAIIGSGSGDAGKGAAIGAGLGALTGAVLGNNVDQAEAANNAAFAAAQSESVAIHEILRMTQAGVREDVIITHIQTRGVFSPPTSDEIIFLQQNGVSPNVIKAYQSARRNVPSAAPVYVEPYVEPRVSISAGYYGPVMPPPRPVIVVPAGPRFYYYHGPAHGHHGHRGPRW